MTILRKFTLLFLVLVLGWTTVACGGASETTSRATDATNTSVTAPTQISDGQYPVQQVEYNDANGEYSLFLLNTPAGTPPTYNTTNLQMARLTDQEMQAGQKSYLKVENGQPVLYLTEDFKIAYVHNVTETQTNPQTGQPETVVVRQEPSFWTPFAGALAGQAIGSLLFRPQYYVPPIYQPGVSSLSGFGGYGSSYNQAVNRYQSRYNAPPLATRSRQPNFRSTGSIRRPTSATRTTPRNNSGSRATGSGYGGSTLRSSDRSRSGNYRRPASGGFGSGRAPSRSGSRSFGGRRR